MVNNNYNSKRQKEHRWPTAPVAQVWNWHNGNQTP